MLQAGPSPFPSLSLLPSLPPHPRLQASSLQYEMLLLTDSISKEDSCWELRLRCGESCPRLWVGGRQGLPSSLEGCLAACRLLWPPAPLWQTAPPPTALEWGTQIH